MQDSSQMTTTTKKQEDCGHFVVLCNTMLISISCLCILVRTFWYIYLDMWKHVWCGFRYAWETSVDHWLRAIRRFFMKLTTYSFSLFYRVCRNTKRWRMKLSRKPILLSVVRGVTIISVDQFYSYSISWYLTCDLWLKCAVIASVGDAELLSRNS